MFHKFLLQKKYQRLTSNFKIIFTINKNKLINFKKFSIFG